MSFGAGEVGSSQGWASLIGRSGYSAVFNCLASLTTSPEAETTTMKMKLQP